MHKTYQLKTIDAQGQSRTQTLQAGVGKAPLLVPTGPGERHLLLDVQQGSAPDNIRVQRVGKQLRVFFDGSSQPDLVLDNFYSDSSTDAPVALAGATEQGDLYGYRPESGRAQDTLIQLSDNAPPQGMALGGAPLAGLSESSAAAGLLAPVAAGGLGMGAIGAGLLGAAAIGGGGGGGRGGSPVNPNSTAGTNVLIKSLSFDSGRNANDFITNDNTLVFKGSLEHFTANGDQVMVQLKNSGGTVLHTAYITPTGDQWVWDLSAHTLGNGRYTLEAQLVDPRGQFVSQTHGASQSLEIDTSVSKTATGESAPNAAVQLKLLNMTPDTQTDTDWVTSHTTPTFNGNFGTDRTWTRNGDVFKIQIFNTLGDLVSEFGDAAIASNNMGWSSGAPAKALADGTYLARALATDSAGNVISQDQHAFVIDATAPSIKAISIQGNFATGIVSSLALATNEPVHYTITSGEGRSISSDYNGVAATLGDVINGTFEIGQFQISLRDTAGNVSTLSNSSKLIFNNIHLSTATDPSYQNASNIAQPGTIGTYSLKEAEDLDLSALILNAEQNPGLHNTLDMLSSASAQRLSLSLNDVLSVGVRNSFQTDGRVQVLVKGNSNDSLSFEDLTAWNMAQTTDTVLGGVHYRSYLSHDGLAEVLVQQGMLVPTS